MADNAGRTVARPFPPEAWAESSPVLGKFAQTFPELQAFLEIKRASANYHKTGSVTLFVEHGSYKLCMNDRPEERSCFVSGRTLGILFDTANRGLAQGSLNWRRKGYKLPK